MAKKIGMLVLLTFVLSTLCLYAAGPTTSGDHQSQLKKRINTLEAIIKQMKKENLQITKLYKDTEKALKDLKKQYATLNEAVEDLCGYWDGDIADSKLPRDLVRKIDAVCAAADKLAD